MSQVNIIKHFCFYRLKRSSIIVALGTLNSGPTLLE